MHRAVLMVLCLSTPEIKRKMDEYMEAFLRPIMELGYMPWGGGYGEFVSLHYHTPSWVCVQNRMIRVIPRDTITRDFRGDDLRLNERSIGSDNDVLRAVRQHFTTSSENITPGM